MALPTRYPPDLIDTVVKRVTDARTIKAYSAATTVARHLNLDPQLVQKWVTKATTSAVLQPASPDADSWQTRLSPGLLHCRFCHQPMTPTETHDPRPGYRCQPGSQPRH